jgi:hypothetical protein
MFAQTEKTLMLDMPPLVQELRLDVSSAIENPRNYPADLVSQLRALLRAGTAVRPDHGREGLYEAETDSRVFYFHVSPVSRTVLLLAVWPKNPA